MAQGRLPQRGRRGANGKGAVYWLQGSKRYGFRYPVSVEEVLDVDPGKRLAYTVLRGIPVRNYRAEVTLTPSPDGTLIRWGASWDRTIMVRRPPVRNIQLLYADRCINMHKRATPAIRQKSGPYSPASRERSRGTFWLPR